MFCNVVVGVDGESGGRDAIALARRLAAPAANLTLAHVHTDAAPHVEVESVLSWDRDADRAAERRLRTSAVEGRPVRAVTIRASNAGDGLRALAERLPCDLLVIGATAHGLLEHLFGGQRAWISLHDLPCALAVAPPGYSERAARLARVGVGFDGSPESRLAATSAAELAERDGGAVRAVHVAPGPATNADAKTELLALAEHVDLLAVGCRGRGAARGALLGSTSNYLLGRSPCALLIVPQTVAGPESSPMADQGVRTAAPLNRPARWSASASSVAESG